VIDTAQYNPALMAKKKTAKRVAKKPTAPKKPAKTRGEPAAQDPVAAALARRRAALIRA